MSGQATWRWVRSFQIRLKPFSISSFYRYFTFLEKCKDPKACTILLRGPSKDILNEIDRNLADAMSVARNVVFNPALAPGGGATEMAISVGLNELARTIEGVEIGPIRAVADALEVIPRTLIQNCGGNAIKTLTTLRAKHAEGHDSWGVDGDTGKVVEMKEYGLYESAAVKIQTLKTAIEVSVLEIIPFISWFSDFDLSFSVAFS